MEKIIFISRRRNKTTDKLVSRLSSSDYNYDYRGKSALMNIIKAAITSTEIPEAKIYIAEGILCVFVGFFLRHKYKDSILICYLNGPDLYFNKKNTSIIEKISVYIKKNMISKVDYFMCISNKVVEDLKGFIDNARCSKVGCFSENLEEVLNNENNNKIINRDDVIIFCADRPQETGNVKGLDIAFLVFKVIKKLNPNVKLWLIGKGTEEYTRTDGSVTGYGHVNALEYFSKAKYILSTSRYDALNLAVLEAIASGVRPLISAGTGASEVFNDNYKEFVVHQIDDYEKIYLKYEMMEIDDWLRMNVDLILEIRNRFSSISFFTNFENTIDEIILGKKEFEEANKN
jgi:glycosyltransferase involved in cell wall biosynthesis